MAFDASLSTSVRESNKSEEDGQMSYGKSAICSICRRSKQKLVMERRKLDVDLEAHVRERGR